MHTIEEVFAKIREERTHQDNKYGTLEEKKQTFGGYVMVLDKELSELKEGWINNTHGRDSALSELVQVAATAVACLQQYGFEGNPL